jgi:type II secretory pathway pseudopilin PulG
MAMKRSSGFTLVELLTSLTAGLIIAVSVITLSRYATNTFYDEVRTASAEANLRIAIDRLRGDVQRTSYMSTGNIVKDIAIARAVSELNTTSIPTTLVGLRSLAGIRVTSPTALSLSTQNGLSPDTLDVAGNFTSTDDFPVRSLGAIENSCQKIWLQSDTPAMYRLLATAGAGDAGVSVDNASSALQTVFHPAGPAAAQYLVRISDDTGRFQYAPLCPTGSSTMFLTVSQPYVSVAVNTTGVGVMGPGPDRLGGVGGIGPKASINPVQVVRWAIQPSTAAGLNSDAGDSGKYDLVRTFLDASGNAVSGGSEVIAEYAVDFKVAFTYMNTAVTPPALVTLPFGNSNIPVIGADINVGGSMPQRIRSVLVRLSTRSSSSDRTMNLPDAGSGFRYRYCTDPAGACTSDKPVWARVRTVTAEFALPNQLRMTY